MSVTFDGKKSLASLNSETLGDSGIKWLLLLLVLLVVLSWESSGKFEGETVVFPFVGVVVVVVSEVMPLAGTETVEGLSGICERR